MRSAMPSTRSRTRRRSSAVARLRRRCADDTGAAVAEFAMISVLLVFLLFAVLQVALLFYVRTVVASSAADGARYAGAADVPTADGAGRASALIADGLTAGVAAQVPCAATDEVDPDSGLPTVLVRCQGDIASVFLPIGAFVHIDASSRVLSEQRP
ncbi:TadE/TadG family type IV pilus assembly protein [Jatrophihabitans sp. YIM 134969]